MSYTLLIVLSGAILLGITSGILGCFALLRQQSLLGDAISHAALPGIVIMFLCTYSTNPWILLSGGAIAGIIGVVCMNCICAHTKLKKDAILGIILSVFFGVVLMSTMLIAPAAAARQWTYKLSHMMVLAGFFGGFSAAMGVCASSVVDHLPTGPMIVVITSLIVFFSLICAPKRGVAQ